MIGRVYKIVDSLSEDVYIGSTFDTLSNRFLGHFTCPSTVIGKLMREHGRSRYEIILVKEYKVADKYQLHAYEQLCINKTKCINKQFAFSIRFLYRLHYRIYNKDKINEYNMVNKDRNRNYYEANRDKIKVNSKEYYWANKDKVNQKRRGYREANKDKIKEHKSQKFDCECGGSYTNGHKSRHMKSKKHLDWESKK